MLYLGLLGKTLALYYGVVQLCVGICQLPIVHEQLEALCQTRQCPMPAAHTLIMSRRGHAYLFSTASVTASVQDSPSITPRLGKHTPAPPAELTPLYSTRTTALLS